MAYKRKNIDIISLKHDKLQFLLVGSSLS